MTLTTQTKTTITERFDASSVKRDFPILEREINGRKLVYLDNAATSQKPLCVIDALDRYYRSHNANVHRGLHTLSEESTAAYEATRFKVAGFIGAAKPEEVIYTHGTTESINLVAYSWGRKNIRKGDRIVLTHMEHHANLVPWIALAKSLGAELEYIPIDSEGNLVLDRIGEIITPNTALVSLTHMSNVLGTINPVKKIIEIAHDRNALSLVDAAQSLPHMPLDVVDLDADFLAFSAHKMLGPTGFGILYGKESILDDMDPFILGGDMINEVRYDHADWAELPNKFEGGTPHIAGSIGFAPAIDYLNNLGMENVRAHEMELTQYALDRLSELRSIRVFGPRDVDRRGGAISFSDSDIHPHDLAQILDTNGVAVRAGHHCAQPLHNLLGVGSTARASFYIYNTPDDVDRLIDAIHEARRYFGHE